jgi:Neuraminidase (sialidase)
VPSGPNEQLPKGGKICTVRSSDGGKSWSKPQTIFDSPADDHDPQITRLSDGRIAVTICCYPIRASHRPFIIWSKDDGHTWSEGKELDHPVAGTEVPQGPIVEAADGRLLLPTYGTIHAGDTRTSVLVRTSRDGGKTWPWTEKQVIQSPETEGLDKNMYEPCIIRMPNDHLLMISRQKMWKNISTDNGETWSAAAAMPLRGDSPNLLLTSKKVLLCGIRFRGMGKTGKDRGTCVIYSRDLGKTWSDPVLVSPCIGGYTGMVELSDGRIFIVYYTEGPGSDIRGASLKVDGKGVEVVR